MSINEIIENIKQFLNKLNTQEAKRNNNEEEFDVSNQLDENIKLIDALVFCLLERNKLSEFTQLENTSKEFLGFTANSENPFYSFWNRVFNQMIFHFDIIKTNHSSEVPLKAVNYNVMGYSAKFIDEFSYISIVLDVILQDSNFNSEEGTFKRFVDNYHKVQSVFKYFDSQPYLLDIILLFIKKTHYINQQFKSTVLDFNSHKTIDYTEEKFNNNEFDIFLKDTLLLLKGGIEYKLLTCSSEQLNVIDYVKLTYYYKDFLNEKPSIRLVKLHELIDKINDNTNLESPIIDKLKLFVHNNYFSLLIEQNDVDSEEVSKEYSDIIKRQKLTKVNNYFVYYKYAKFLENRIKSRIDFEYDRDKIHNLYQQYSDVLIQYESELSAWFAPFNSKHDFILESDAQLIIIDKIKIRLNSKYLIPKNYSEVQSQFVEYKQKKFLLENLIQIKNTVFDYEQNSKSLNEQYMKEASKADKRSIEIITLFSAIVMFVAGDLQLFKNISDTKSAINVMLVFGFSLSVFVGLIATLIGNMDSLVFHKKAPDSDKKENWLKRLTYKQLFMWYLLIGLGVILFCNYFLNSPVITKVVYSLFNIPITIN